MDDFAAGFDSPGPNSINPLTGRPYLVDSANYLSSSPFLTTNPPTATAFNPNPITGTVLGAAHVPMNRVGQAAPEAGGAPIGTSPPTTSTDVANDAAAGNKYIAGVENSPSTIEARMWQKESGGQQFDPKTGKTLTSPAGALGVAQIMPSTGPYAAKLAGLPWDPVRLSSDHDYNLALGHAYYQQQVKDFGDPIQAAAAYNAGPVAVGRAVSQANATGKPWVSFLPKETQDYVNYVKGGGESIGGGGTNPSSTIPTSPPPPSPSSPFNPNGLYTMAILQSLFPQHKFSQVDYDPFKVMPK